LDSTFDRMRSSTGVFEVLAMAENFRCNSDNCLVGRIEKIEEHVENCFIRIRC
jgi:hypothetical protein